MTLVNPRAFAKHTRLARLHTNLARILWESARYNGCYILGAKGSGKSTVTADIAFYDFLTETPQIIIDPLGVGTIDAFCGESGAFSRICHRIFPNPISPAFGRELPMSMLPQLSGLCRFRSYIRQGRNDHCLKWLINIYKRSY
jgi:hypothetical protein